MKLPAIGLYLVSALFWGSAAAASQYPDPAKGSQVDDYHGTKVADPYRWLENPDSAETRAWIEAENKITFDYLKTIPARSKIKERLTDLWNYERYGVPFKEGGRYFITRNNGLQNQAVLYTMESLEATPKLLLDPNVLSADGTVALKGYAVSTDGKVLAYGLSAAGSDWEEWKFRDVSTVQDLKDDLKWVKFSGASWARDGKGIFYSRYDEPNELTKLQALNYYQKLFYHRLGTSQSEDVLVYQRADQKEWGFDGEVTDDGNYLIISVRQGTDPKNRVFYKDLKAPDSRVVELLKDFDAAYHFVGNDGPVFWFKTDLAAPRGRLITIDTANPARTEWKEIVGQKEETLGGVHLLHDQVILSYMKDAHTVARIIDKKGGFVRNIDFPGLGTAAGFSGKQTDSETFYSFTSFSAPGIIYHYDLTTGKSSIFRKPEVRFSPDDYVTEQVFYASKDGTKIPMFMTKKKSLRANEQTPVYLYGYGGFNISLTPSFSPANLLWMEMGGIYAQPTLRGGGEYGEEWHQAGTKLHKQNVFDDFIGAAEYLIKEKYTSPAKLAIGGGSNGGLLVGACLTQRPELFGAALPAVGVMDMLRFHKFTIGWAWTSDYGSADDAEQFKALYAYSPLHNIRPGRSYPATLVTTADHDDRVVPAHSFKFAATLQAAQAGPAPTLIRIETKAGHGAGKPTAKIIEEAADKWAFLTRELKMEPLLP